MTSAGPQTDRVPFATSDVERIVREVLARLNGHAGASTPPAVQPAQHSAILRDRLVTVETIARLGAEVQSVQAPRRAIVTPAARDLLREKKITLQFGDAEVSARPSSLKVALGVAETSFEPATLVTNLRKRGLAVEQTARIGLVGVVDALVERARLGGERAALFTGETEAALCLANRSPGIRAVHCGCLPSVRRALRKIGPNLLIVEPRGKSQHLLDQMLGEFCAGASVCPSTFQARLA